MFLKTFSKELLSKNGKNILSKSFKTFMSKGILYTQPGYKFQSLNIKEKNLVQLYKRNFFSNKEKESKNKEDAENSDEIKEDAEGEAEGEKKITRNKYHELKKLYNETEEKLTTTRTKFDELRRAFLENNKEIEAIKIRNEREIKNTKEFAISKFAKDLLDVHDNFERALSFIGDKKFSELNDEEKEELFNNFIEGIKMTQHGLIETFKKHGLVEYRPLKERFDPNKHEAVFDYEDEEIPSHHVGQVMQSGFKIGERVLRPAKVGVVKKKN
jgi:molecular chaperone GrpE